MADRHLEAATEAIVGSRLGWRANLSVDEARPAVADAVTAYLSSLLGELPEEALRAAEAETEEDWWVIRDQVAAFLRSLRNALTDGGATA